jgi:hypothetical protein
MAAKKEGTDIETVQASRTRGQFLCCGAEILSSERCQDGSLVEIYRYKKAKGSAVRALMHGLLDVSTYGAWEVVGTPIEIISHKNAYFTIRVFYDQNEIAYKVELM